MNKYYNHLLVFSVAFVMGFAVASKVNHNAIDPVADLIMGAINEPTI